MTMREPKPYKCPQCVKTFANNSYLSQHMRIHLGVKPFGPCNYCGKRFTQLSHLQQHIRTHTGEKPYRCKIGGCDKSFSQLSNLQSHSRCHQSDKPFKCNSCYKCFNDEATLLEHIPKHKDSKHLKVHICHYCGKSYTQALYLDKHMTKHNDRRTTEFRIPKQYYGNELSADNFDTLNQLNQFNQLSGFARFQMDAVANVSAANNGANASAAYAYPTVTNPNALIGNAASLSSQLNLFQQQITRQNFRSNGSTPNGNNNERNGSIPGFNMITPLEKINSFNQAPTNGTVAASTNGTNAGGNY
uniref:C2H2-type domain-containing protein n=1 Tax=Panagrolaimus superbus TaxID=310955 RepID=A0A914Z094_9BILA